MESGWAVRMDGQQTQLQASLWPRSPRVFALGHLVVFDFARLVASGSRGVSCQPCIGFPFWVATPI